MSTVGNDATIALWVGHAIFAVVSTVLGFLAYVRNVKKEAQLAYFFVYVLMPAFHRAAEWLTRRGAAVDAVIILQGAPRSQRSLSPVLLPAILPTAGARSPQSRPSHTW
jgi:hypothetical protein